MQVHISNIAFNLLIDFKVIRNGTMTKIENNHMRYDGSFGNIGYADELYDIQRVDVFSPALHMMLGVTYPVEVQIKAKSKLGGYLTIGYLFDILGNAPNAFFQQAGFVGKKVKEMPVANTVEIGNNFSLKDLVEAKRGYVFYEGTSLLDDCEPSLIFVSNQIDYINEDQANQILGLGAMKSVVARPIGLILHQNINPNLGGLPSKIKAPLPLLRFHSSFENSPHIYFPDENLPLGTIPTNSTPGWLTPNGTIRQVEMTSPPAEMKYMIYYYEPQSDGSFSPVYITVPYDSRGFVENIKPASLDVWIRANEQSTAGLRRLIQLKMGVYHTPQMNKDQAEKDKVEAEKQALAEQNAKKAAVQEKIKQTLKEIEKIQRMKRTRKNIKFKRICDRWKVISIVNRDYNQPDAWALEDLQAGGDRDLLVCDRWKVIMINDDGSEINESGEVVTPEPEAPKNTITPIPTQNNTPPQPQPELGTIDIKKCGNYLLAVLNQRFSNRVIKDYVVDKCKDWKSKIFPKATANSFAQVGKSIDITGNVESSTQLALSKQKHIKIDISGQYHENDAKIPE